MRLWQNLVVFALFGCVVYFPVLLVECVMQRREILRLRSLLEDVVEQRNGRLKECPAKRGETEYRAQTLAISEIDRSWK